MKHTVPKLVSRRHTQRQDIYALWSGAAKNASLSTIGKLCALLHIEPGNRFVWGDTPDRGRVLGWNIAAAAMACGFNWVRLGHCAELHSKTAAWIWRGDIATAYLVTLSRIAAALDVPATPFSTGALLLWDDPSIGSNES